MKRAEDVKKKKKISLFQRLKETIEETIRFCKQSFLMATQTKSPEITFNPYEKKNLKLNM